MITLAEAHNVHSAVYHGDRGDWLIVMRRARDFTPLERANWDAALDRLRYLGPGTIVSVNPDDVEIESSGHYLVGYIESLIVRPGTLAHESAECILAELEDNPILDEELYSQYEQDSAHEIWFDVFSLQERIQHLQEHEDSIFAARAKTISELAERATYTYEYLRMIANE